VKNFKKNYCSVVILLMSILFTACTVEINPTFLNLEYLYSIEGVDSELQVYDDEFTWFETFASDGRATIENVRNRIRQVHGIQLPEHILLDGDSFIAISIGSKLQKLYYFEESRYNTGTGQVFARPVFEREYYLDTMFIYRVDPFPKYSFIDQRWYTDDRRQFNYFNNIPFEFWEYDISMQAGHTISDQRRTFERSILRRRQSQRWQESTEPLYGYINISEIELRTLPTRNSRVLRRLAEGADFTILGYVEDGEDIDGNTRWYYIWHGNRPGYVHSSVVTITSSTAN